MFRNRTCYISGIALALITSGLTQAGQSKSGGEVVGNIVPRPAELETRPGSYRFSEETVIFVRSDNPEAKRVAEYLASWMRPRTGLKLPVRELARDGDSSGHLILATVDKHAQTQPESYHLTITPERVGLFAATPRGLFYAVQSLRQLLPAELEKARVAPGKATPPTLPCVRISDEPRYKWRGMLLDCGRHFMSKQFIKRYIDLLAYHKMNVLHWHLTEDQGWRVEIKKYPRLTEVGAWRGEGEKRYGGFYSQADIKEIVAYAAGRYVTVVPEIEMPGHSVAALAAYPALGCTGEPFETSTRWGVHKDVYCAGNDKVFDFLQDVLSEVIELFPSDYIHIGGDEVPKDRWKACGKCQSRIKAESLKDEHELQSYFIRRIEKFLNSKGKRLIGWDEILEGGLAPNATVQSWRGMKGAIAAATSGHDVISSPTSHCYLDYPHSKDDPGYPGWMGATSLEQAYSFEPTPAELSPEHASRILGAEGNIWTEHAPQDRIDKQVFPRLCALAEAMWSPREARNWDDFQRSMQTHYKRLDALGVKYHRAVAP